MIENVQNISKKPMALITMEEDKWKESEMLDKTNKKAKNKKKQKEASAWTKAIENETELLKYSLL